MNLRVPILLVLAATLSLATGCSGGGGGGGDDDDDGSTATPVLDSVDPLKAAVGDSLSLLGSDFGATQDGGMVTINGVNATVDSWSDALVEVTVPDTNRAGIVDVVVTRDTLSSAAFPLTVLPPPMVYVNNDTDPNEISAFAIGSTGGLLAIAGSPFAMGGTAGGYGGDSFTLRYNEATGRLFATLYTHFAILDVDPLDGSLTAVTGSPILASTTAGSYSIEVSPDGSRVFFPDESNSQTFVYAIASNGAATQVAGSPFATGGTTLASISPDGTRLYIHLEGGNDVHGYSVSAAGALTPLGTPLALSAAGSYTMVMAPGTDRIYLSDENQDQVIAVATSSGSPVILDTESMLPYQIANGLQFSPDGSRLYVVDRETGDLVPFDVDAGGKLSPSIAGPAVNPSADDSSFASVAVSRDGRFVYVTNESAYSVHVFAIDDTDGDVTWIGSTSLGATGPADPSGIVSP